METCCLSSNVTTKRVNKWPWIRHSLKKKKTRKRLSPTFDAFFWMHDWTRFGWPQQSHILFKCNNSLKISFQMVKRPSVAIGPLICFYHGQFLPVKPFQIPVAAAVAPSGSVLEFASLVRSCCGSLRNTKRTVMLSLDPAALAWATRVWATSSPEPPVSLKASRTSPGTSPGRTTSKRPSQASRM